MFLIKLYYNVSLYIKDFSLLFSLFCTSTTNGCSCNFDGLNSELTCADFASIYLSVISNIPISTSYIINFI